MVTAALHGQISAPVPKPAPPPSTGVWVLRALWVVMPLGGGPALAAALDGRTDAVRTVSTVLAWGTWAAVLVALLVPRATSLTVVRVATPAALAAMAWAAGPGGPGDDSDRGVVAVISAALAVAGAFAPVVGDAFVNGSAYGAERRFALRCPPTLAALAVVTWIVVAAGAVAGPLLLAVEQWVAGGVALVLGAGAVVAGARSLHGLARRWIVFVPSGLVVHDPVARPDAVMAPRRMITRLGPAPVGTDALDLTLGALGLAIEVETSETLPVTVRRSRRDLGTEAATRILVTPTRPAAVLAEAAARRIPVA